MSETSGRCRREVDSLDWCPGGLRVRHVLADAIDRLAADVAAVKAVVCDGSVAAERDRFLSGWGAAIRERDEARAEVERLRSELAARPAAAGWLKEEERWQLRVTLDYLRPAGFANSAKTIEALLARAGSPPVVEVPAMVAGGLLQTTHLLYRIAMDNAGVAWSEVPRE